MTGFESVRQYSQSEREVLNWFEPEAKLVGICLEVSRVGGLGESTSSAFWNFHYHLGGEICITFEFSTHA